VALGGGLNLLAIYVSTLNANYSRSAVYFQADSKDKIFIKLEESKFQRLLHIKRIKSTYDSRTTKIVIMSPSHILVPWFRLLTNFEIVLDAGWPLSDSKKGKWNLSNFHRRIFNLFVDFAAFRLADKVVLETVGQTQFVESKFLVPSYKLFTLFTGFNEHEIVMLNNKLDVPRECLDLKTDGLPYILFRGKSNDESGLTTILKCAEKFCRDLNFVIVTDMEFINISKNVILINRFINSSELTWLYKHSIAVIGQVSQNLRLEKTIPHKLFEAAYFGKCYISPSSKGILELANFESFVNVFPVDELGLARSIRKVILDEKFRNQSGINLQQNYLASSSQHFLSEKFRQILEMEVSTSR